MEQPIVLLPPAKRPKSRPHRGKPLSQALEMLDLLHQELVNSKDGKLRAIIARSWCHLNEEIRKLRMRGLPKSIDVSRKNRGKPPTAFSETPE